MEYHDSVRPEGASVTATTNDLPSYVCPMSNMGTNTLPAQKSGVPLFCCLPHVRLQFLPKNRVFHCSARYPHVRLQFLPKNRVFLCSARYPHVQLQFLPKNRVFHCSTRYPHMQLQFLRKKSHTRLIHQSCVLVKICCLPEAWVFYHFVLHVRT